MTKTRCAGFSWHINPHPITNSRAVEMCLECPILRGCAKEALTAGASLDGSYIRPANDVVQGGVVCQGDYRDVAEKLAAVAGEPAPDYRDHRPRLKAPDHCGECQSPMVKRDRKGTRAPEGTVQHMARGLCTDCYMRARRQSRIAA